MTNTATACSCETCLGKPAPREPRITRAGLRREFAPIHAARLDTAACEPISPHRADRSAEAACTGEFLCSCEWCHQKRMVAVRETARRISARLDEHSGVRSLDSAPDNDVEARPTSRPPAMPEKRRTA